MMVLDKVKLDKVEGDLVSLRGDVGAETWKI